MVNADCGHPTWAHLLNAYVVDSRKLCSDCWQADREARGLVEKGCISPTTMACPDRKEPYEWGQMTQRTGNPKWTAFLAQCECYRGHDECRKRLAKTDRHVKFMVQLHPQIIAIYKDWDKAGRPRDWKRPDIECPWCGHKHDNYGCAWGYNNHVHYKCLQCGEGWME